MASGRGAPAPASPAPPDPAAPDGAIPKYAPPVGARMAWTLHQVPGSKKAEVEAALRDDIVSRQSHKVRDAATAGGPPGQLYVLVEGAPEAVARADLLLKPLDADEMPAPERESLYRRFKDEEDSASAGMGLFFTE